MNFRSPIFCPARRCAACVRQRHALLAAGDHDRVVAERDVLGAERHGPQARAADLVDAPGGALLRQAGVDVRLAGRVLALAGGQHLAEDRLRDLLGRDAGALEHRRIAAAPSSCAGVLAKAPLKLPTARARGRCDYDVGHFPPPRPPIRLRSSRRIRRESPPARQATVAIVAQSSTGMAQPAWAGEELRHRPPDLRRAPALPTTMPTWPVCGRDACGRAGSPRASGAASGGGAMVSRCAETTSAGAATAPRVDRRRRGSASRRWRSGCGSASRPAGRCAAPAGIGTPVGQPVLERDEEPGGRRRPGRAARASGTSATPASG